MQGIDAMNDTIRWIRIGLLILLLQSHSPASDLSAAPVLPGGLGVNIHFTDPRPGEMRMLADAGFTWVRMDFAWGATEREKGRYDFAAYDRLLDSLDHFKIRALFILDYSNSHYDHDLSPSSDEGRAAFAKWAAAASVHFKGRGVIWEMYNEPNIFFWRPKPDVDQYARLALAVGKALREAEPAATYIGPAVSTMDFKFLEACFKAGLLEYWSAVSVHPYRQNEPESVIADYEKLLAMIARYAPAKKQVPIISGEWGYSSAWDKFDETRQAKFLPRQWLTNVSHGIPISIWYDWHEDGLDPREPEHHFGTAHFQEHAGRDPLYDPKPAYLAAKTLTHNLDDFEFECRLAIGRSDDYLLLFRRGHERRLAVWTTAGSEHAVVLPVHPARLHSTSYRGDRLKDLAVDDSGAKVTVTDGPQYLSADPAGALDPLVKISSPPPDHVAR